MTGWVPRLVRATLAGLCTGGSTACFVHVCQPTPHEHFHEVARRWFLHCLHHTPLIPCCSLSWRWAVWILVSQCGQLNILDV